MLGTCTEGEHWAVLQLRATLRPHMQYVRRVGESLSDDHFVPSCLPCSIVNNRRSLIPLSRVGRESMINCHLLITSFTLFYDFCFSSLIALTSPSPFFFWFFIFTIVDFLICGFLNQQVDRIANELAMLLDRILDSPLFLILQLTTKANKGEVEEKMRRS